MFELLDKWYYASQFKVGHDIIAICLNIAAVVIVLLIAMFDLFKRDNVH